MNEGNYFCPRCYDPITADVPKPSFKLAPLS